MLRVFVVGARRGGGDVGRRGLEAGSERFAKSANLLGRDSGVDGSLANGSSEEDGLRLRNSYGALRDAQGRHGGGEPLDVLSSLALVAHPPVRDCGESSARSNLNLEEAGGVSGAGVDLDSLAVGLVRAELPDGDGAVEAHLQGVGGRDAGADLVE